METAKVGVSLKNSSRELILELRCIGCFNYSRYIENTVFKELKDCPNFKKCIQGALAKKNVTIPIKYLHIRRIPIQTPSSQTLSNSIAKPTSRR